MNPAGWGAVNCERRELVGPAFNTPPDMSSDDRACAAWLTTPPGAVFQYVEPARATLDTARWLVGPAYERLIARYPHERNLLLVFDLRLLTGRSAVARSRVLKKGGEVASRLGRVVVIFPDLGPQFAKSAEAAIATLRGFGLCVELASSLREVVERYRLKPASPAAYSSLGATF